MMYPFLTLDDETEITHSDVLPDGTVKVYVEKPDEKDCFHFFTCYLPDYTVKDVFGFCPEEVEQYMQVIRSTAHLILEFSRQGGFEHASGL
ncbi:MAG: hypothetical protein MR484_03850 [Ruminococcus sp.]|nr:hypothetical protein [Ruminococcus sp.]